MKRLILASLFAGLSGATFTATGTATASTDMKAAIQMARAQNPKVRQARERLDELRAQSRVVFGALLPVVNGTFTYQQRKDSLNSNAPLFGGEAYTLYQMGVQVNQPLIQGTALWDAVGVAKRDIEIAENEFKIAERDLDSRVAKAFYRVLLFEKTVANLEALKVLNTKSVETSEKRRRVGKGQWVEVLQAKTQSALLIPKIAQAKNQRQFAASELAVLLKLDSPNQIQITGKLAAQGTPEHLKWLLDQKASLETQPEMKRAILNQSRLESAKGVAFSKHLPTLGLFGTWGRAAFIKSDLLTSDAGTWSLGLQATIPLFSGLTSFNDRAVLAAQTHQLEQAAAQVQTEQLLNRLQTKNTLELSFESLASTSEAFSLAKQSLVEAQKDFVLGTIDYQSLLVSQQSLLNAETAHDQAQFDWVDSELSFCTAYQIDFESCVLENQK